MGITSRFMIFSKLDRDLKLLIASVATRRVVMACLQVMRNLYLYSIGFDLVAIGLLSTIAMIVGAIRSGVIGILSDRYGRKPFIIVGGILSSVRLFIYATSVDFTSLAIAQGVGAFGEGAGAGQPSVSGIIADRSSRSDRTKIFSVFAFTNALAAMVGSLIASTPQTIQTIWLVSEAQSYQTLFWGGVLFSILSFLLVIPVNEDNPEKSSLRTTRSLLPTKSLPIIYRFSFVRAVGGFGFGVAEDLIGPWLKIAYGVGEEVLGPIYAVARFIVMFSYIFVDKVARIFGDITTIALSRVVSAIAFFGIPLSPDYTLVALLLIIYRITLTFTMPIRQAFITTVVDPSEKSAAVGLSNLSRMTLRSIAPTIGGFFMQSISLSLPFYFGGVIIAVNGVLYRVLFPESRTYSK
jgi:MFS family permease